MSVATLMDGVMTETQFLPEPSAEVNTYALAEEEREEVLSFLAERAVHTVCMAGLIRDNGIMSAHNRGTFYGCRNSEGRLEGVALVGHATLVEARTRRAFREFALVAQCTTRTHFILGESDSVEEFWSHYADAGQPMRRACREFLFELRYPLEAGRGVGESLRRATPEDLDLIVPVHAGLAEAGSGVNPLNTDPGGFRARCLRRIEQGRTWVVVGGGRLLFKADVQADTPEVIYLEGVYVNPTERGTGIGRRSMTRLGFELLGRTRRVCLLANEENERAHA